jgi:hypothetical protein
VQVCAVLGLMHHAKRVVQHSAVLCHVFDQIEQDTFAR